VYHNSQGKQAVLNGAGFKKTVLAGLQNRGFELVPYNEFLNHPEYFNHNIVIKNRPYTNAFNKRSTTGFILKPVIGCEFRVECIWQQVPGTANHKVAFKMDSYPEENVIIVYDGGIFDKDTVDGMKTLAHNKQNNIRIMSHTEFLTWINETF
jgi:hypothetical protein